MAWLITLVILLTLGYLELWPLAAFWLCYMLAASLTHPDA